jgi:hypothetical protein
MSNSVAINPINLAGNENDGWADILDSRQIEKILHIKRDSLNRLWMGKFHSRNQTTEKDYSSNLTFTNTFIKTVFYLRTTSRLILFQKLFKQA